MFQDATIKVEFLGARKLLELARRRPKTTYELRISKSLSAVDGYVVLSPLSAYNKFVCGDGGKARAELFESNVRDFQGDTEVNAEIIKTLKNEKAVEFWWMNNGVTILASKAALNGDVVTIENPQIVNGLQTSKQIAKHFETAEGDDTRNVLVKIISSGVEETQDKIIKATNSQNAVQPATLRATDKVQRDIEETLKSIGLYYDRRKNYYRNEGKPPSKIISVPLMAQAIMSIILGRPDSARARPSGLIKDNTVYAQIFSEAHPISMYSHAAQLMRIVDRVLKSRSELNAAHRSNLRFYVLLWVTCALAGKTTLLPVDLVRIDVMAASDAVVQAAADEIWKIYERLGGTDQVAKGPELRRAALDALDRNLGTAARRAVNPKV